MNSLLPLEGQLPLQLPSPFLPSHLSAQTGIPSTSSERIWPAATNSWSGPAKSTDVPESWIVVEHGDAGSRPGSSLPPPGVPEDAQHQREEDEEQNRTRDIPDYVLDYAPVIHLFSREQYWPSDMVEHLEHTSPLVNFTAAEPGRAKRTLHDLAGLNQYGRQVFLTSDDDIESEPAWLGSAYNRPSSPGHSRPLRGPLGNGRLASDDSAGGQSNAPAVLICVPKEDGVVDAFWFFFYSYNLGNKVLGAHFGNHVGDWEHTMVRFRDGEPEAVFYSEHFFGEAYSYGAVEKIGKRVSGDSCKWEVMSNGTCSPSGTLPPARMPCTARPEYIGTSCRGACCLTRRTRGRSGIRCSTHMRTRWISIRGGCGRRS